MYIWSDLFWDSWKNGTSWIYAEFIICRASWLFLIEANGDVIICMKEIEIRILNRSSVEKYSMVDVKEEIRLISRCMEELGLIRMDRHDSVTPKQMIHCCNSLLGKDRTPATGNTSCNVVQRDTNEPKFWKFLWSVFPSLKILYKESNFYMPVAFVYFDDGNFLQGILVKSDTWRMAAIS